MNFNENNLSKKFVRNNTKIAEIMVALLHSSKHYVETGWDEKDLGFLKDHAAILLVLG